MDDKRTSLTIFGLVQTILTAAAGVDREIFVRLPRSDQRPYVRIGICCLLMILFASASIALIYQAFYPYQVIVSLLCLWLAFVGAFILVRKACKRLLNKFDAESRFYFILLDVFFCLLLGGGLFCLVCNREWIMNDRIKKQVYAKLDSLQPQRLFYDSLLAMKEIRRAFDTADASYPFSNFEKFNGQVKAFAGAAYENAGLLRSPEAFEVLNGLDTLNEVERRIDSILAAPLVKPKDFYFYSESIFLPSQRAVTTILNKFSTGEFGEMALSDKLVQLVSFSSGWAWFWCVVGILSMMILFAMVSSTLNSNNNDFYHQLLAEREKVLAEELTVKRKKIVEDFRIESELKNLRDNFQQAQPTGGEPLNTGVKRMTAELDQGFSPASLMTAARLQYEQQDIDKALEYVNKAIELDDKAGADDPDHRLRYDTYELKAFILKEKRLFEDADQADRKAIEIKNENSFLDNRGKNIVLSQLTLEEVSIFDNCAWTFRAGINILLGKNGYGKSHLFGLIIALLYDDKRKVRDWVKSTNTGSKASLYLSGEIPGNELASRIAAQVDILREKQASLDKQVMELKKQDGALTDEQIRETLKDRLAEMDSINSVIVRLQKDLSVYHPSIQADNNTINSRTGKVPVLAIPDVRYVSRARENIKGISTGRADLARNGAAEFLNGESFGPVIENVFFRIALRYYEGKRTFDGQPFDLIRRVLKDLSADRVVLSTGEEKLQDLSLFRFFSIEYDDKSGSFAIKVQPEDSDIILPIQQLSQGTFSILAICCVIHNFLASVYGEIPGLLERPAIVIIDEIDAHLHPSWQRKLIPILRDNFPGVQFLLSGHSPLLVEGCKGGEVSVLRRTTKDKYRIETVSSSLIGMTIDQLYSLVFEIENKDLAVRRYNELAPYLDSFKLELDSLKKKKNELQSSSKELSADEIRRMNELQDLVDHVGVAANAVEKAREMRQQGFRDISTLLKTASSAPPADKSK